MKILIIDTETTGLTHEDEAIEIAALMIRRNHGGITELSRYHGFQEPTCEINPRAFSAHGLSKNDLRGKSFDLTLLWRVFTFDLAMEEILPLMILTQVASPGVSKIWTTCIACVDKCRASGSADIVVGARGVVPSA